MASLSVSYIIFSFPSTDSAKPSFGIVFALKFFGFLVSSLSFAGIVIGPWLFGFFVSSLMVSSFVLLRRHGGGRPGTGRSVYWSLPGTRQAVLKSARL